jgi:hypothetical protein
MSSVSMSRHAARVIDLLHFDMQAVLGVLEAHIALALGTRQLPRRHAERAAPECCSARQILALAVDDEAAELAPVHPAPYRAVNGAPLPAIVA